MSPGLAADEYSTGPNSALEFIQKRGAKVIRLAKEQILTDTNGTKANLSLVATEVNASGNSSGIVIEGDRPEISTLSAVVATTRNTSGSLTEAPEIHSSGKPDVPLTIVPCCVVLTILLGLLSSCILGAIIKDEGKKDEQMEEGVKGSTMAQTLFNMIMNLVGEGMLSLPFGVAAGTGVMSAIFISVTFAAMMGYSFHLMGRCCYTTGEKNHRDISEKLSGPILGKVMAVILMVKTIFTCLSYSIVIGQSFSRILHFLNVSGPLTTQGPVLIIIAGGVLLPLCMQRDLSILSYTSFLGVCGGIFVVFAMQFRYYDGSYTPQGHFYNMTEPDLQPNFGTNPAEYWGVGIGTFVLLGSLSTAYIAHYNAPKYYMQLRDRTPQRFGIVVLCAFGYTTTIYAWIMAVGYLTFGKACDGLVLNNYAEQDSLVTAARVAIGSAVVFGFPLAFTALRDATVSVFFAGSGDSNTVFRGVTVVWLAVIVAAGCFVTDLGLVNSLGGAIFGAAITLIFPGVLLYHGAKQGKGVEHFSKDGNLSYVLMIAGIILMFFGSTIVILKTYAPQVIGL